AFCGGKKTTGRAGTDKRLGQSEAADLFKALHRRQPLLLLLFRPIYIDRAHGEADVHTQKGGERWVDACDLHLDKAQEREASTGAAVALDAHATDAQLLY